MSVILFVDDNAAMRETLRDWFAGAGYEVALAEKTRRPLDQLSLADFRSLDPAFGPDVKKVFDLSEAMARRTTIGAPGTREVQRQIARWQKLLSR